MKFNFCVCIVMIPFACGRESLLFLNEFGNFILAERAKNFCPLAHNPQKILNLGTINTVQ
jgi:hypothetical protein